MEQLLDHPLRGGLRGFTEEGNKGRVTLDNGSAQLAKWAVLDQNILFNILGRQGKFACEFLGQQGFNLLDGFLLLLGESTLQVCPLGCCFCPVLVCDGIGTTLECILVNGCCLFQCLELHIVRPVCQIPGSAHHVMNQCGHIHVFVCCELLQYCSQIGNHHRWQITFLSQSSQTQDSTGHGSEHFTSR